MHPPSGYWMETNFNYQEAQIDSYKKHFSFRLSFVTPASSSWDISANFWTGLPHHKQIKTHIEIFMTNSLEKLQTSIFTGCISLPHCCSCCIAGACSSTGFSERRAHGKKKKINTCSVFCQHWSSVRSRMKSLQTPSFHGFVYPSYIYIQASSGCFCTQMHDSAGKVYLFSQPPVFVLAFPSLHRSSIHLQFPCRN